MFQERKAKQTKYSGTYLSRHLCQVDTSLLRTPIFSPTLVNFHSFDIRNPDTSKLGTTILSPKGVLYREVPLYINK
jgi:hypothetical protein